jgi:hypothetical protein
MAAVLVALFDTHASAERTMTALVRDGFPTDRVKLISVGAPATVEAMPAPARAQKFQQYFHTLLGEGASAEALAERVSRGMAAVSVLPRGTEEIRRARELLEHARPLELEGHDLDDTALEHAAARRARPMLETLLGTDPPQKH